MNEPKIMVVDVKPRRTAAEVIAKPPVVQFVRVAAKKPVVELSDERPCRLATTLPIDGKLVP